MAKKMFYEDGFIKPSAEAAIILEVQGVQKLEKVLRLVSSLNIELRETANILDDITEKARNLEMGGEPRIIGIKGENCDC